MEIISGQKSVLRRQARESRRSTDPAKHRLRSLALSDRLWVLLRQLLDGQVRPAVLAYFTYGGEPDLLTLVTRLQGMADTYFPVIATAVDGTPAESRMAFHRWQPGESLHRNRFGIDEPLPEAAEMPSQLDSGTVLVPGLMFDRLGYRLGYGGGYYDRFLGSHSAWLKIGVCFGDEMVENLPQGEYDVAMDWVVTEAETWEVRS